MNDKKEYYILKFIILLMTFVLFISGCNHKNNVQAIQHESEHVQSGTVVDNAGGAHEDELKPIPPIVYEPEYEVTWKPNIQIRYHDYYNPLIHGNKAEVTQVEVTIGRNNKFTTYTFSSLEEVELTFNELDAECFMLIDIVLYTDNNEVLAVSDTSIFMLNVYLEPTKFQPISPDDTLPPMQCLCIEDADREIIFDYKYPTDGITYPLTQVERELLSSLVALEHGGGPTEAKRAVASVVFNRRTYGGGSIHGVVYAKNAFSPASLINPNTGKTTYRNTDGAYKSCKDAVDYVSAYGVTIPKSVLYFRSGHYHGWSTVTDYKKIGSLYFSGNNKLINKYKEWNSYK